MFIKVKSKIEKLGSVINRESLEILNTNKILDLYSKGYSSRVLHDKKISQSEASFHHIICELEEISNHVFRRHKEARNLFVRYIPSISDCRYLSVLSVYIYKFHPWIHYKINSRSISILSSHTQKVLNKTLNIAYVEGLRKDEPKSELLLETTAYSTLKNLSQTETGERVTTVFMCGTKSSKCDFKVKHNKPNYYNGELISRLFHMTKSEKIICDGAGSGEKDISSLDVKHYPSWNILTSNRFKIPVIQGVIIGSGFSERVTHLYNKLNSRLLLSENEKEVINMVGWSRGAAGIIRLANRLGRNNYNPNVEINLILIDPVPGYGREKKSRLNLNESNSVKNVFLFIAMDEQSFGFMHSGVTVSENQNLKIYPVKGNHVNLVGGYGHKYGGVVRSRHRGIANLSGVSRLVRHRVEHILKELGTDLNNDFCLNLSNYKANMLSQNVNKNHFEYKRAFSPYILIPHLSGYRRKTALYINGKVKFRSNIRYLEMYSDNIYHVHNDEKNESYKQESIQKQCVELIKIMKVFKETIHNCKNRELVKYADRIRKEIKHLYLTHKLKYEDPEFIGFLQKIATKVTDSLNDIEGVNLLELRGLAIKLYDFSWGKRLSGAFILFISTLCFLSCVVLLGMSGSIIQGTIIPLIATFGVISSVASCLYGAEVYSSGKRPLVDNLKGFIGSINGL